MAYTSLFGFTESAADIRLYLLRVSSVYHSDSYVSLSTYVTTNPVPSRGWRVDTREKETKVECQLGMTLARPCGG